MRITVKLFAHFREGRFKEAALECAEGTRVREIILDLGLRPGEMGIVLVNHLHAPQDQPLKDLDSLALFPLVGGG